MEGMSLVDLLWGLEDTLRPKGGGARCCGVLLRIIWLWWCVGVSKLRID